MNQPVNIILTHPISQKTPPAYETPGSSAFDLRACIDSLIKLAPGCLVVVPNGIKVQIPIGYELQVRPRSGFAAKQGITVLNSPGTIDSDYRGVVGTILINTSDEYVTINPGDRISQGAICPVVQAQFNVVEELDSTARGEGGFGHTGVS